MNAGRPIREHRWPAAPAGARIVADRAELAAFYGDAPAAHVYALADLDEPFWPASRWYRRGDAVVGLVGLPSGEGLACYAVATRDPHATLGLVADLAPELPVGLLVTGPSGLAEALAPIRPVAWHAPHVRYLLADRSRLPPTDPRIESLGRADLADLEALYASEPGAVFFLPHMLDDGAFVGVREEGVLVAAAGTHVVSTTHGVAAIGAVYAALAHRGRGLGRAVTVAVARRLAERVGVVGLNVAASNQIARRVYESIGFVPLLTYDEAELA